MDNLNESVELWRLSLTRQRQCYGGGKLRDCGAHGEPLLAQFLNISQRKMPSSFGLSDGRK
jgi:hypothetical protein